MAERWQQWMPFHIDRFRGSPDVQSMHPAARCGYLYLLAAAWQMEDCALPNDDLDLASLSGLGDELWGQYGLRIRRKFSLADGRLLNPVLRAEWLDSKEVYEKRRQGAVATNSGRHAASKRRADAVRTQSERRADTVTGTETLTSTEAKTSTIAPISPTDAELQRVYRAYPRKVGPMKAVVAIRKAVAHLATGEGYRALTTSESLGSLCTSSATLA